MFLQFINCTVAVKSNRKEISKSNFSLLSKSFPLSFLFLPPEAFRLLYKCLTVTPIDIERETQKRRERKREREEDADRNAEGASILGGHMESVFEDEEETPFLDPRPPRSLLRHRCPLLLPYLLHRPHHFPPSSTIPQGSSRFFVFDFSFLGSFVCVLICSAFVFFFVSLMIPCS